MISLHLYNYVVSMCDVSSLFAGAGAYSGCCYCTSVGEYCPPLSKIVYLDHRRFLPSHDSLRKQKKSFPSRELPPPPPDMKTMKYVDEANARYESATTKHRRTTLSQSTGCKGSYALRKLPHHDRHLNTPVEPMHLIKDIVEHLVRFLSGTEDSIKVRKEEQRRKRFRMSWIEEGHHALPPAPFRLSVSEQQIANRRAQSIRVSHGFDWKPQALFVSKIGMKSHTWKQLVSTGILKYCLRGLLGTKQRCTVFKLCDVLARLCVEVVRQSDLDTLEDDVHRALCYLERDFPTSVHVVVFHLLHHLPFYLRRFGPIYGYWMFPFERFNSWIIRRVHNRRYPESTVVQTYRLYEWAHFLQSSGHLPDNSLLCPEGMGDLEKTTICHDAQLDSTQFSELQVYYRGALEHYDALCVRYEKDKKRAKRRHQLRKFPSMSSWMPQTGPPLTNDETVMCQGMQNSVTFLNNYSYKDVHGRIVRVCTSDSDTKITSSSHIAMHLPDRSLVFGQVQAIFRHTFIGKTSTLVFVHWFSGPQTDSESGLFFVKVDCDLSIPPVVPVCDISKPLVTAVDCDTPNKLWILNYL